MRKFDEIISYLSMERRNNSKGDTKIHECLVIVAHKIG